MIYAIFQQQTKQQQTKQQQTFKKSYKERKHVDIE